MLKHLTLKDFAVVGFAELGFDGGMTVISGETGAGKSLLVDALLSLTGARADTGMVRHGAERAELSAEFELDPGAALAWLTDAELDDGRGCQLRRLIRADGGSRAWINGRPATLAQMSELGSLLVEIHGQHEHQALLERGHQLDLLDAFARNGDAVDDCRRLARDWIGLDHQLAELARMGDPAERVSYLEHQSSELGREVLDAADIEKMLATHRRQAGAAGLLTSYDAALARLSGDDGVSLSRSLRQAAAELGRHLEAEPRLAEFLAMMESAQIQLDEASNLLERLRDDLELDPAQLDGLEARLTRLHELSRKHRVPIAGLAERRQAIDAELDTLRDADALAARLRGQRDAVGRAWTLAAARLTATRTTAAANLGTAVARLMAELGMSGGTFVVQLQPHDSDKPGATGAERCEFMVSANPGQPARPLRKVASGGELARISLAIEVAALGLDAVPTMVFDEVDSGIGGAVAEVVGQKLRTLGASCQVLCVTHLPQVAAQGHQHFRVSKSVGDVATHSTVSALDSRQRVEELARMLGGVEITRETRANARQMLARAQG